MPGVDVALKAHVRREPSAGTPARRPGSFRRTTTHTSLRPDGILGDVKMQGLGRDIWTGPDGAARSLAQARFDATIAFVENRSISALTLDPDPGVSLNGLVGRALPSGFRRALDQAWPASAPATPTGADLDRGASLTFQLLDELPTAGLVSGYAIAAAGMPQLVGSRSVGERADICAGWSTGGTLLTQEAKLGYLPPPRGPLAPTLESPGDPEAWHPLGPDGPNAMRRWRRIDLWRPQPGGPLAFEAFLRDSHFDPEGVESIVHQFLVTGELDAGIHVFLSCQAEAAVVPSVKCPGALASVGRVTGTTPHDLRDRVRHAFVGNTTCTYLNDTMRALAALPHMAAVVERLGEPV